MKDEISVESLTLKQMCNCLGMIKKLKQENILDFDINTTQATINCNEAVSYLEKQNVEQAKEIDRLNNIINSFEKWLESHLDEEYYWFKMYDKLKELKGDSK